ncbi:folate-binding protein YgfZ [Phenylobacterium sp.]|uniref:CAF17-like 4Fe-4S cluster assembly/insertion protein YgfZ n=1 Tax=Phenylobacterium sp. TaxID=1871053 RepID=UPI0030F47B7B
MTTDRSYTILNSRALIALSGEDWRDFLQGLITQDVETLQVGEARFAALLTPQGRLLFDLFVVGREDGAWLDVEGEHRAALTLRLTMYRLRAKVTIAADETPVAALFGGEGAPDGWIADPRLAALGWRGYGAATPADALQVDEAAYDTHRLTLGVPGPADWGSEKTYPIEANFDLLNGIDFHKGCFVGQETTSRMKRRGQIKNRMLPLTFDGAAPAFDAEVLLGDRRAGEVLSGQDGRAMALVRLDRIDGDLTADGKAVRVERPAWLPL